MVGPRLPEASDFIRQSLLFPHNSTFRGLFANFSTQCYQTYFSARERNTAGHETRCACLCIIYVAADTVCYEAETSVKRSFVQQCMECL